MKQISRRGQTKRLFTRLWWGAILITLLELLILGWPYMLSAYHLERAGRALSITPPDLHQASLRARQAISLTPNEPQAYRFLGQSYLAQEDYGKALTALTQYASLQPRSPLPHLALGDVYDALGNNEQAIDHYEKGQVGDRRPQLAVNYLQLADRLWARGDLVEPVTIWQDKMLGSGYGDLYAHWRLAEYYADDEDAALLHKEGVRYFPLESIVSQADRRLEEYQAQAFLELKAKGLWNRETLLNVISYRVWQDQNQATEDLLQALLAEDTNNADLRFYLGELYHRQGEWQQAEAAYHQTLGLDPEYTQAYLRLGMVAEAKSPRNLRDAAKWYAHYYALAPNDLLGLKRLMEVYDLLDEPESVILRDKFEAKTDVHIIVAELLGVNTEAASLGENIISNGDLEDWQKNQPLKWKWADMTTRNPFNKGLFSGGKDSLAAMTGLATGRVDGLWLQYDESRTPARSGWWYENEVELNTQSNEAYVLGFFYRTEGLSDPTAEIWLARKTRPQKLRHTNGAWQYQVILLQEYSHSGKIQPLFRIFGSGRLWVDDATINPIKIR